MTADVAIAGAGICGAFCAWELARAGLSVIVAECAPPCGGATAAGMGHIALMDDSPAMFGLCSASQRLWAEWRGEIEMARVGALWVAELEEDLRAMRHPAARRLDARQTREAEPELREGLAGAMLVESDSVVYAPAAAAHVLKRSGALVVRGRVKKVEPRALVLEQARIDAAAIVVAAGSESARLIDGLPVAPRKGHLAITGRAPGFVHHQLIELGYTRSAHSDSGESVAFNVQPRTTGQVLIGSSRQYGAADAAIEPRILKAMLRRAVEFLPRLAALEIIRAWTGLRAASPDHLPLIGPWPLIDGVYVATGHEGLGVTLAPVTGRMIAAHIAGVECAIPMEPFLAARCAGG